MYLALNPDLAAAIKQSQHAITADLCESVKKDVVKTAHKAVEKAIEEVFEDSVARDIGAPPPEALAEPERVDDEQLFQLFAIYCGDVKRCALAAGLDEAVVEAKAAAQGWKDKIKLLIDLKTSARPGDSERGINRAVNFVQAHRYRNYLQRVLTQLTQLSDADLYDMLCSVSIQKDGTMTKKLNTRAFADLASALEKCHAMSYAALNDTVGERKERGDEPEQHKSAAEMHLQITRAMEEIRKANQQAQSSTSVEVAVKADNHE